MQHPLTEAYRYRKVSVEFSILAKRTSFVALGRALNEKLGSCSITAMNDLVPFDESDGLSAKQKRKLFKALGSRLDSAEAPNTISHVSVT